MSNFFNAKKEFLDRIGKFLQSRVRDEIKKPKTRYRKRPREVNSASPYMVYGSGKLWDSVEYNIRGLDKSIISPQTSVNIDILMNDYGVDYVFGRGSFPGGGNYAYDTRSPEDRLSKSPLITALTEWARTKPGLNLPVAEATKMAYAVRRNLFKYGYGNVELITYDFEEDIFSFIQSQYQAPQFQDYVLSDLLGVDIDDFVDGVINIFGKETIQFAF